MRVIVMFDLPIETSENRRAYSRFRKFLIQDGYIMMQKSIYSKIVLNQTVQSSVVDRLKKNLPKDGIVQVLCITEKQFSNIEFLVGQVSNKKVVDSMDRLILL